ncbi:MAG: hypothetical protein DRN15_00215 [Thermoprotei archaeon]|nr:MAG: hypothetical protein DRN15_00215 [Thermoprotei archaeon]RLF25319.1 MAG: hypothetical protein DRM97_02225 [Thermoprotei archaeon]
MDPIVIIATIVIPLIITLLLYLSGRAMAPRHTSQSEDKMAPYACGEDFPPERLQVTANFFWYGLVFLVFDVIDFLLALAFGVSALIPAIYLSVIILALIVALRC